MEPDDMVCCIHDCERVMVHTMACAKVATGRILQWLHFELVPDPQTRHTRLVKGLIQTRRVVLSRSCPKLDNVVLSGLCIELDPLQPETVVGRRGFHK